MADHRYLQDLKNLGAKAKDTAAQARLRAIEEHWQSIERVCRERAGAAALSVARSPGPSTRRCPFRSVFS